MPYVKTGKPRGRPPGAKNKPKPLPRRRNRNLKKLRELEINTFVDALNARQKPDEIKPQLSLDEKFVYNTANSNLPHLPYPSGLKFYKWAREFFESTNKMNLLVAGNQATKSSTQIRKCIHWATAKELWPKLWKSRPQNFFYLYPTTDVIRIEFQSKWLPEFLPRGSEKDSKGYGWEKITDRGKFLGVKFSSGVHVWFKSYAQRVSAFQGSSVHAVFCFRPEALVLCESGLKPIGDIEVGEKVLSHDGKFHPVLRVFRHKALVRDGHLSTDNHPFATVEGWKPYGELTSEDRCVTHPAWKLIEKLYCLKGCFTIGSRGTRISGERTTLLPQWVGSGFFCMSACGKLFTNATFQRTFAFTISTLIRWIIGSRICNALVVLSTPRYINGKNGENAGFTNLTVPAARKNLKREVLGEYRRDFARLLAGGIARLFGIAAYVKRYFVRAYLVKEQASTVPTPVGLQEGCETEVINLEVESTHTYFCQGFLVHNCDEELPVLAYHELQARLNATDGYYHQVFTPTLAQEMWQRAMNPGRSEKELFPEAWKREVSLYDCMFYEDGTPGQYSESRIAEIKQKCGSQREVDRRVFGKFVQEEGVMVPSFDPERHLVKPFALTPDYQIYSAVDIGGGGSGHPSAFGFLAVHSSMRKAFVVRGWRGDGIETTASDVMSKYLEVRGNMRPVLQIYDYSSKEFGILASRIGEPFAKAEKSRELGIQTINSLFKNDMLFIFDIEELHPLVGELLNLRALTSKMVAKDDFFDFLRYSCAMVPWDWSGIESLAVVDPDIVKPDPNAIPKTDRELLAEQIRQRRAAFDDKPAGPWQEMTDEIEVWNELSGNS